MPYRPDPVSDLARIYRERIPTSLSNTDKIRLSRLSPHRFGSGSSGLGFLRPVGSFLKTAVESLDPRVIAREGGRSVEHVVGDARELGRSIVTGEDTLSESPSARAYQAAGGGLEGTLAAALPYVNVGTAVMPTTRVLTPGGRLAMSADVDANIANRLLSEAIDKTVADETANMIAVPQIKSMFPEFGDLAVYESQLAKDLDDRGYSFQNFPPEAGAVYSWTQPNEYRQLQAALRNSLFNKDYPTNRARMADALDRVIASSPRLANEVQVYRGVSPKTNNWEQIVEAVEQATPGEIFLTDKGFTATSFSPSIMKRFSSGKEKFYTTGKEGGYNFVISVPRGSRGINVDAFLRGSYPSGEAFNMSPYESEFLLPRNSGLRFIRREGNNIFVELVPGPVHGRPYQMAPQQTPQPLDPELLAKDFARMLATMHDEQQVS